MTMKIFLSAVTRQFKECRDALATDLRAIGCEVKVQEDFQQGPRTLIERLEEYVAQCERVIALVGDAYGYEASGVAVPPVDPPRSYTQWEYDIAMGVRLNGTRAPRKDVYLYLASDRYLAEHPVSQPDEHAARQRRFRDEIEASGEHWAPFDTVDQLCRTVLRDGWKLTERPLKPNNLPLATIGTLFKGREPFLDDLRDRLGVPNNDRAAATAIVTRLAVHGLGGVGKTRAAVEYAWRHADDYTALLFVSARTVPELRANLANLAGVLGTSAATTSIDEQLKEVLDWLEAHPGWLLIIDNVDTVEAVREVEQQLAKLQPGHVLITSRIGNWSAAVKRLDLDVLAPEAGVAFLLERTPLRRKQADDAVQAAGVARELDGLALALEQAGAYIDKQRLSLAEYLQRWAAKRPEVLRWHDLQLMQYPASVAITWETTFAQLEEPERRLLEVLSWLSPDPTPLLLIEAAPVVEVTSDPREALAGLAGYSLARFDASGDAVLIHRLVQEITRGRIPDADRTSTLQTALNAVDAVTVGSPWDVRTWPIWTPLVAHAEAVSRHADAAGLAKPTTRLMNELGQYWHARGQFRVAEPLMRRALAIDENRYGPDHPNVAVYLNNLAQLLQDTNRPGDAEPLMRRALAIDENSYGPDHPRVAIDLSNLAQLLKATNRVGDAEPLMRRALAIDEKSYGPDHPDVAIDLNNLALLLQATNRLGDAEPLMRRALAIDENSYGPDHPNVARDLNNLGLLLQATNRLGEAEPLMRPAVEIFTAALGPDHPYAATARRNLAALLQALNHQEKLER
jgi:tetratricopeptide (TPR) repeat protein